MTTADQQAKRMRADSVLAALRACSPGTVRELVASTELSRPTVISLLGGLEGKALVRQSSAAAENQVGRPAASWELNPSAGVVVAADVLVNSVLLVAASVHGEILSARTLPVRSQQREARLSEVGDMIAGAAGRWTPSHGPLRQICISTTGVVDGDGVVQRSDLVPQWTGLALARELEQRLGAPVMVDNDINMAAYGEFSVHRQAGAIGPQADLLMVQMTRGFNTGLVLGGRVHHGRQWNAGEVSDILGQPLDHFDSPTDEWVDGAAVAIGSVAAVIDPDLIVISGPTPNSLLAIRQVVARLIGNRPVGAPPLPAEVSGLGWAASVTGALGMALQTAAGRLLGIPDPRPVAVRNFNLVTSELEKGPHSTMTTTVASQLRTDTLRPRSASSVLTLGIGK